MGQKFCPNRSISYGFRDIKIFSLFAKIQDGRQKWRKLKQTATGLYLLYLASFFYVTSWGEALYSKDSVASTLLLDFVTGRLKPVYKAV